MSQDNFPLPFFSNCSHIQFPTWCISSLSHTGKAPSMLSSPTFESLSITLLLCTSVCFQENANRLGVTQHHRDAKLSPGYRICF